VKAVRVVRNGPPTDSIEVLDVPEPDPEPGGVRIRVAAASVNFGDIARCRGGVAMVVPDPPFTLGMDVCGVVDAAGDGAEEWIGRRVVAMTNQSLGGMAEAALAPATSVFDAPPDLDDVEAAAFTIPFHVSYLALHRRAALEPGEHLLVVGAASAVGTAAVQLGVAAGADVMAVVGRAGKADVCRDVGAALVVDRSSEDVFDAVMTHTDGHGADVAFDVVGGDGTETIWTTMAQGGRYLAVGFNDDPQSGLTGRPLRRVSMGNFSVLGVILAYLDAPLEFRRFGVNPFGPAVGREVHASLLDLVARGSIRPVIGRRITMDGVAAALDDHEQRRTSGRTVVEITPRNGG
jgi:NADPH2:quinone reductase